MMRKKSKAPATAKPVETADDPISLVRTMFVEDFQRAKSGKGLDGKDLTPAQHRLLRGQLVGFVERLGKISGETLSMPESKIVKLPAFRRVVAQIVTALEPWPKAMVAVGEALKSCESKG